MISAADDADAGCVFGYEIITEEREVFSQFVWFFQSFNPVVMSRLTVSLPAGWRADAQTFNHDKIEPTVSGNAYTWELRNLPPVEIEPSGPRLSKLVARIAVNIFPPQGKATMLRSFASWKDVSRYASELNDPQAGFNEADGGQGARTDGQRQDRIRAHSGHRPLRAIGQLHLDTDRSSDAAAATARTRPWTSSTRITAIAKTRRT